MKKTITIIIVVLVIAAAGVGGFFYFKKILLRYFPIFQTDCDHILTGDLYFHPSGNHWL